MSYKSIEGWMAQSLIIVRTEKGRGPKDWFSLWLSQLLLSQILNWPLCSGILKVSKGLP